jgi:hypothetical protein
MPHHERVNTGLATTIPKTKPLILNKSRGDPEDHL